MRKTDIGFLTRGEVFQFDGEMYVINSLGNKDINNVLCINLKTRKRKWFDLTTEVEVER